MSLIPETCRKYPPPRAALCAASPAGLHTSAYVSIRQHTSNILRLAHISIRQLTSDYVSIRQHSSAYVSIRQHTPAYVSIREHTCAYVSACLSRRLSSPSSLAAVCSLATAPQASLSPKDHLSWTPAARVSGRASPDADFFLPKKIKIKKWRSNAPPAVPGSVLLFK